MKKTDISFKDKMIYRYLQDDIKKHQEKSSNINVLLNRIKLDKKNESRKKLYFSAAASTGLILFGLFIF
jgi:hypothetical protein